MHESSDSWATLELKVIPKTRELGEETLDTLSYLLAELPGVGGVETRDGGPELLNPLSVAEPNQAQSPSDPTREDIEAWFAGKPGVVVYTTPEHLETLDAQAHRIASSLSLGLEARTQVREDDTWRDMWKQFYQPIDIGEHRLRICPSWQQQTPSQAEHTLVLDPGRAFGTGLHESTRLCLQALAGWSAPPKDARVLDLGCGSGILGLSVAAMWDKQLTDIVFCDLDPEAVETTRENAQLNAPWVVPMQFISGTAPNLKTEHQVDWLIANIRPEVLIPDAASICNHLAPGGRLLLSGILDEESQEVLDQYTKQGLECMEQTHLRGWTALTLRKTQ